MVNETRVHPSNAGDITKDPEGYVIVGENELVEVVVAKKT